jgi:hypothetical protein
MTLVHADFHDLGGDPRPNDLTLDRRDAEPSPPTSCRECIALTRRAERVIFSVS